jgi:P27 family predicted phage terminase small subunit
MDAAVPRGRGGRILKGLWVVNDYPSPPIFLDEYALEEWDRLGPGLFGVGIFYKVDLAAFSAYCVAYSTFRHAQEAMNKIASKKGAVNSLVSVTAKGNTVQNTLVGIRNVAARDMVKFASEFGMTPSARAKISADTAGVKPKGKFSGLIGRRTA